MQKIKDLNINWQDRNTSNKHSMAASSSCPAWSSQWGHPLGSPVPSHLLLHPHCHRPPRRRLLCCGGDQPHPGQQAHRLWSHCCDRDQSAVLSNKQAQLVFRFLATSCTGQVSYSGLCTSLDKVVQILAALSPLADHVALQLPEGLKPGHQPADLPWLGTIVQTVQSLKGSAVLSRQLSCSTVNLLFCPTSRVTSGFIQCLYWGTVWSEKVGFSYNSLGWNSIVYSLDFAKKNLRLYGALQKCQSCSPPPSFLTDIGLQKWLPRPIADCHPPLYPRNPHRFNIMTECVI